VPPDVLDLADRLWRGEISTERHHPVAHLGGLAEITEAALLVGMINLLIVVVDNVRLGRVMYHVLEVVGKHIGLTPVNGKAK